MQLIINGEEIVFREKMETIDALLTHLQINKQGVIVEQNAHIIDKTTYHNAALTDGDKLEIVHFVGGG